MGYKFNQNQLYTVLIEFMVQWRSQVLVKQLYTHKHTNKSKIPMVTNAPKQRTPGLSLWLGFVLAEGSVMVS
jgi:hypothetical protein